VQPVTDHVSGPATILVPSSCVITGSTATVTGSYNGFVAQSYLRVGDVVELYVYTAVNPGYPHGIQLASLSSEHPASVDAGTGGSWTTTAPINLSLGVPVRCGVTVQATHQFEGAPNNY
jgi:hypothetical protein